MTPDAANRWRTLSWLAVMIAFLVVFWALPLLWLAGRI